MNMCVKEFDLFHDVVVLWGRVCSSYIKVFDSLYRMKKGRKIESIARFIFFTLEESVAGASAYCLRMHLFYSISTAIPLVRAEWNTSAAWEMMFRQNELSHVSPYFSCTALSTQESINSEIEHDHTIYTGTISQWSIINHFLNRGPTSRFLNPHLAKCSTNS